MMPPNVHLGYACLNTTLPIRLRTLRLATYQEKGDAYLKTLILNNLTYTLSCLRWNEDHRVDFFRVSSDLVPLATHPEMGFPWDRDDDVLALCETIRQLAQSNRVRLSMHPGQYTLINSPDDRVVARALEDLEYHRMLGEKLGVTDLIIHVGGVYGDKTQAMHRFVQAYRELKPGIRERLRLENDERSYTLDEVLTLSGETGVPVVADFHHHRINGGGDPAELLERAVRTWDGWTIPKFHLSSGRNGPTDSRHHDLIRTEDALWAFHLLEEVPGLSEVYLMLEAKQKEQAILSLRREIPWLDTQS